MKQESFVSYMQDLNNYNQKICRLEEVLDEVPICESFIGDMLNLAANAILEATVGSVELSETEFEHFWDCINEEDVTREELIELYEELTDNG